MTLITTSGDKITALIDTGASLSVILANRADELDLQIAGETRLSIAGFNSSMVAYTNIYVLSLKRTDSQSPLSFLITGTPSLPSPVFSIPPLSTNDKNFMVHNSIPIEIHNSGTQGTRSIDMIIGNDMIPGSLRNPRTEK
uniref:Peptidase A2 domain-containing protein n=1 Tax=Caenorhabditis tropicalis TaxID=1561998 RepID=A0A1I7SYW4_9PELO